jgi:hypothetical protein
MNKKHLIERELEDLDALAMGFKNLVEEELSIFRKEPVHLYLLKNDRYRLLILRVWTEKYRVPLSYLVATLVPFWESFVQRKSYRMKKQGLNVRVSTLTGKKSELYLQEKLAKDFPNNIHKRLWISNERERIYASQKLKEEKGDFKTKSDTLKSLLDFSSLKKYVRHYRSKIRKQVKEREKLSSEFRKRPYRGNPFREETV